MRQELFITILSATLAACAVKAVAGDADAPLLQGRTGATTLTDSKKKMESGSEISTLSEGAPRARKPHKPRGGSDVVYSTTTVTTGGNGCAAGAHRIKATRDYAMGTFSAISASALCDIHFTQGSQGSVKVVIDADEKYDVELSNSDGCLRIERKKPLKAHKRKKQMDNEAWNGSDYVKSNNHIDVYITSPRLGKLDLEGMASFEASTIQTPELDIELNGVGTLKVERLECDDTDLEIGGVRTVSMSIVGKSLDVESSGVGSVGLSFKGEKAKFESSGVTKMVVRLDCDYLTASSSGVSTIQFSGRADNTNINNAGVSKIDTDQLNKY